MLQSQKGGYMARQQEQEKFESKLPPFQVTKSEDWEGWLVVKCGYEDCNDIFLVRASRWLNKLIRQDVEIIGRSCPYCFSAGRIPASYTSGRRLTTRSD
jgi:hypothetical protein